MTYIKCQRKPNDCLTSLRLQAEAARPRIAYPCCLCGEKVWVDVVLGRIPAWDKENILLLRQLVHDHRTGALHPGDRDYTFTCGKCTSDQRKRVPIVGRATQ
jgi:hypothetical protein